MLGDSGQKKIKDFFTQHTESLHVMETVLLVVVLPEEEEEEEELLFILSFQEEEEEMLNNEDARCAAPGKVFHSPGATTKKVLALGLQMAREYRAMSLKLICVWKKSR